MGSTIGELTRILSDAGRNRDIPLVWNAYEVAKRAHRGQRRINGDRYITHPVEVATIVAHHGGTVPAVCAALLHDVIEESVVPSTNLQTEFGPEIATMVKDMTTRTIRTRDSAGRELTLLAVADRLHNLRTLRRVSTAGRQRASLDTLVFHVPWAHQLNVPTVAAEMTDLACAALDSLDLDRLDAKECWQRLADVARRADLRLAIEAVAAFGGGAAAISGGAVADWALATGGTGILALVAAALFGRDPRAAKRLAELLAAWRRG
jgi:(p)ppGpp synthase/HD superfamily hydrolase